jgi:actin-like protein 6B
MIGKPSSLPQWSNTGEVWFSLQLCSLTQLIVSPDEVSALVVDVGSSSVRAGYAGDDTPKAIVPTYYGYKVQPSEQDVSMTGNPEDGGEPAQAPSKNAKMYIGQDGPSVWRAGMEIGNPMREGLSTRIFLSILCLLTFLPVEDFNPISPLISHALVDLMHAVPSEHPVLVTEPAWNTPANRERMAEIMFEEFQVPAFYIANTSVLNA